MRATFQCLFLFWLSCNTRHEPVDIGRNRVPGRLEFDGFTLNAPKDWRTFSDDDNDSLDEGPGKILIDRYLNGLTNGKETLRFDYRESRHRPVNFASLSRRYAVDTIDGFMAVISIPNKEKEGFVEMRIDPKSTGPLYLSGYTRNIPMVLSIFESIHFPNGDPTKTGPLTIARFGPNPPSGSD